MRFAALAIIFLFTTMFTAMYISELLKDSGEITQEDIYNLTKNRLIWNLTFPYYTIENISDTTNINSTTLMVGRISNLIYKTTDWIGYMLFETTKISIEFAYNNDYDFGSFMHFLQTIFIISLILVILPLLLPIMATIYLIFKGVKKLVIKSKEWWRKQ